MSSIARRFHAEIVSHQPLWRWRASPWVRYDFTAQVIGGVARMVSGMAIALSAVPWLCGAEPLSPAERDFFENRVRPVLVNHCYECHSAQADIIEGGLRLDSRPSWIEGGAGYSCPQRPRPIFCRPESEKRRSA